MRIVVVGSGVSGAHAALTLLERGREVELWDVGRQETGFVEPGVDFHDLKGKLEDPIGYFLGKDLEAIIPPAVPDLIRFPPSRSCLVAPEDPLSTHEPGSFAVSASLNKGGLANAWGANALAFDEDDLRSWPIGAADLSEAYRTVFARVQVAGPEQDELSPHLSGVTTSQPPVALSGTDEWLLGSYQRRVGALRKLGVTIARARLAVTTERGAANACDRCDRCLWGCPRGSIYNPRTSTLVACEAYGGFRYRSGRLVLSLLTADNRVTGIRYVDTTTNAIIDDTCDAVFLASGALQSGGIFLRTLQEAFPQLGLETEGLMDTTMVKLPYAALPCIGRPPDQRSFQYNRLIAGVISDEPSWPRYLHAEVLHLTSLVYYPLIERMPFDSRLSKQLFYSIRAALGVFSLFFPDRITTGNRQVLVDGERWSRVGLRYEETAEKRGYIERSVRRVRRALWRLRCLPRPAVQMPPGGAIHYAGTIPMGSGPKRCDASGCSNLLKNLFIADGAAFPSLPSKSITMSLAAHATRVARLAEV